MVKTCTKFQMYGHCKFGTRCRYVHKIETEEEKMRKIEQEKIREENSRIRRQVEERQRLEYEQKLLFEEKRREWEEKSKNYRMRVDISVESSQEERTTKSFYSEYDDLVEKEIIETVFKKVHSRSCYIPVPYRYNDRISAQGILNNDLVDVDLDYGEEVSLVVLELNPTTGYLSLLH